MECEEEEEEEEEEKEDVEPEMLLGSKRQGFLATKYLNEFGNPSCDVRATNTRKTIMRASVNGIPDVDSSGRDSVGSVMMPTPTDSVTDLRQAQVDNQRRLALRKQQTNKQQTISPLDDQLVERMEPSCSKRMQLQALTVTDTGAFTFFTTGLITINAIVIGVQTDWMAQTHDSNPPFWFMLIECFFCTAFTVELLIRMVAQRLDFFLDDYQWNLFDIVLVFLQIVELAIEFASSSDDAIGTNVSFMRILRILRLVRVMRLVRVVRYITELRTIVSSIINSLKSLLFTILIMIFLIYVISVVITQLVTQHAKDSDDEDAKAELRTYFGSVTWSCFVFLPDLVEDF